MGFLNIVNTTLNIVKLLLKHIVLPFKAHRHFFKLTVTDDDRIVIACGNPATKLLAVSGFKVLLPCH